MKSAIRTSALTRISFCFEQVSSVASRSCYPGVSLRASTLSVNGEVRGRAPSVAVDTDMVSEFDPSSSDSGVISRCAVVKPLKLRLCRPIFGRKSSKAKREVIDMGKIATQHEAVVRILLFTHIRFRIYWFMLIDSNID